MFALSKLFRRKQDFEAIRRQAVARVAERRAAGDTRGLHDAQQSAFVATTAALREAVR